MVNGTRGTLIVFEGLDRAGKTTQCNKLVENLRAKGRTVKTMRFPSMWFENSFTRARRDGFDSCFSRSQYFDRTDD